MQLIDIINNPILDEIILDAYNHKVPIEASSITRHKGYFTIYTSFEFELNWIDCLTFAQALKLLKDK